MRAATANDNAHQQGKTALAIVANHPDDAFSSKGSSTPHSFNSKSRHTASHTARQRVSFHTSAGAMGAHTESTGTRVRHSEHDLSCFFFNLQVDLGFFFFTSVVSCACSGRSCTMGALRSTRPHWILFLASMTRAGLRKDGSASYGEDPVTAPHLLSCPWEAGRTLSLSLCGAVD